MVISKTFRIFHWLRHLATSSKCLFSNCNNLTSVRRQLKKTPHRSVLRQNEQHEQIEIMANHGPLCKGIENDKGNSLIFKLWERQ